MSIKNIVITGYFKFPYGSAGASRIRNISNGLMQEGVSVTVITQARCENDLASSGSVGMVQEVPFISTNETSEVGRGSVARRIYNLFRAVSEGALLLKKMILSKQVDAVILYTLGYHSALPVLKVCRKLNIPVVTDVVEWLTPDAFPWRSFNPQYLQVWMKRGLLDSKFNGATVISRYLYKKYCQFEYPVLLMPGLCNFESSRVAVPNHSPHLDTTSLNLAFVGGNKVNDGLDDAINALRIGDFGSRVNLTIIGNSPSDGRIVQLQAQVDRDLRLKRSVHFLGRLSTNDYWLQLMGSDALLLPRRDNTMARAAFPNRLPEFLSTGKPVITTSVPDVPEYLADGEHALIVPPNRPDLLAKKIDFLLGNREECSLIGVHGRIQAKKMFDYRNHASRLLGFMNNFV